MNEDLAMELRSNPSLVIPYGSHSSGKCGYCKHNSHEQKTTWGMMAERLTVSDYQYLIDRGWRRSGAYCYKPLNQITCCPAYTIRCDALHFRLKRSHKRVLKNMFDFLKFGKLPHSKILSSHQVKDATSSLDNNPEMDDHRVFIPDKKDLSTLSPLNVTALQQGKKQAKSHSDVCRTDCSGDKEILSSLDEHPACCDFKPKTGHVNPGATSPKGAAGDEVDDSRLSISSNKVMKARTRRWIAKQEHLRQRSVKENCPFKVILQEYYTRRQKRLEKNKPKEVEDFLQCEPVKGEAKHFIEIRLIRTTPPTTTDDYKSSLKLSHKVYEQYQIHVHKDDISDCTWDQFQRFLITSPLVMDNSEWNSTSPMFGSYHQQYWLDGEKLIAVGVIDLLPRCLSSVYVFYDPDYSFLHLGTYTALREIAFVRHLARTYGPYSVNREPMYSNFDSYYLGYYIHSCPKMSYKAQYGPAYLACPETFNWLPLSDCLKALDNSTNGKYARFSHPSAIDTNAIPMNINLDLLDSQIYFCIKYDEDDDNDDFRNAPISLFTLRSRLSMCSIPIFREWARLLGNRVLSGQFQIVIRSR
ncbi:unnamed protein product [Heterobilharzia americana]|nr:unnamed protein product [Heterobilharzia americana]